MKNIIAFARTTRDQIYGPQIFPADAGRPACAESGARIHWRADGSNVRIGRQQSVEKVHRGERAETNVVADAVSSARAAEPFRDCRPSTRDVPKGRRDDRTGRRVTAACAFAAIIPDTLTQAADPFDLIPSAWRTGRQAKPTLTVSPDLFAIAGTRAAENWLASRPTARPNQWCRSTFDNLVAGLGRIPRFQDCLAAFERSFKRRIEAASHTDRKAAEVRA